MATNPIKLLRSLTAGNRPSGRVYGEPYVNLADGQLGIINNSGGAQDLIGVPIFSANASYPANSTVNYGGLLYTNPSAVTPGAFSPSQWNAYSQVPLFSTGGVGNILLNPDHAVNQFQPGYSGGLTAGASKYYSDQWCLSANNNAQVGGQVTGQPPNTGYVNCLAMVNEKTIATPAAADLAYIFQPVDSTYMMRLDWGNQSQGPFPSPQPVVICFWLNSTAAGTYALSINNAQASSSIVFDITITAANVWQFFSVLVPPDTGSAYSLGGGQRQMTVALAFGGGANWKCTAGQIGQWVAGQSRYLTPNTSGAWLAALSTVYMTGMVMLPGNLAPSSANLPMLFRPISDETFRCYRYAMYADGGIYVAGALAGQTWGAIVNLPVVMRAPPTVAYFQTNSSSGFTMPPSMAYISQQSFVGTAVTSTTGSVAWSAKYIVNARM